MKLFCLYLKIHFLASVHVHGGVSYLKNKIPLADWLALKHTQTTETCDIECAKGCENLFHLDQSCNAIIFDESNNICTKTLYVASGPAEPTGLRVAWASSAGKRPAWFAIDRMDDPGRASWGKHNLFATKSSSSSPNDEHPWLAVDLMTTHKVTAVKLVERIDTYISRNNDMEVRVGNEKPFARNTNGDTLYSVHE